MSVQLKRSLSSSINQDHVLKQGQLGIEMPSDTNTPTSEFKLKIGDGVTKWNSLPYFGEADLSSVVPTSRKINNKSLTSDISLTASDVGALSVDGTAVAASKLASVCYITADLSNNDFDVAFNGTGSPHIRVENVLGVANGGTGRTSPMVGKCLTGEQIQTGADMNDLPIYSIASKGAEIFNDYDKRTWSSTSGAVTGGNIADGQYSHAEGHCTTATGIYSHAEGFKCSASGETSHAEGYGTVANGKYAHTEGRSNLASAEGSHAEGASNTASGVNSHAEGNLTTASGTSSHSEGNNTIASNYSSHANGKYNKDMITGGSYNNTTGDVMIIGNGTAQNSRSNCFRVTYAGAVYGVGSFHTTGADYAEYFEWQDRNLNNEDRVGYFVTVKGRQVQKAQSGDYIIGVTSGNPCIIGNADEDWLGRWVHDDFDRFVKEYLEEDKELFIIPDDISEEERMKLITQLDVIQEDGQYYKVTPRVVDYETSSWRLKANPNYDSSQKYIERKDRPEWSAVGMLGVLSVRDDGSCQTNGYCKCADGGIATEAQSYVPGQTFRVIERVSENVVRIVFR